MNVGQTKYSLTNTETYADKTSFIGTAIVGDKPGDDGTLTMPVVHRVAWWDITGIIIQTLTVTFDWTLFFKWLILKGLKIICECFDKKITKLIISITFSNVEIFKKLGVPRTIGE